MHVEVLGPLLLESSILPGQPSHLSAASGLVKTGSWIHVVPDDALHLATFRFPDIDKGRVHRLLPDPPLPADETERKRLKPDLESLAVVPFRSGQALLALGSGSTEKRCRGVLQPLYDCGEVDGPPLLFNLTPLYQSLAFPKLNIEGVAEAGGVLYLAQRGNSAGGRNAIVELNLEGCLRAIEEDASWNPDLIEKIHPLELQSLNGVRLTLTDLSPWNSQQLLFAAAAEDTDDPYADGPVLGSVLGRWSIENGQIFTVSLNGPWKVEGIQALQDDRVLMVTDGDDPKIPALLLEASGVL